MATILVVNITRLVAITLIISVAGLAVTTLVVSITAAPFKLARNNAYKATRSSVASSATWSNCIKSVSNKLVNIILK